MLSQKCMLKNIALFGFTCRSVHFSLDKHEHFVQDDANGCMFYSVVKLYFDE